MRLILILTLVALSSCAHKRIKVIYHSVPMGATVYTVKGEEIGQAPVSLERDMTNEEIKNKEIKLPSYKLVWVSGAEVITSNDKVQKVEGWTLFNRPKRMHFTITRPKEFPNREADYVFGLETERNNILQQTANKTGN